MLFIKFCHIVVNVLGCKAEVNGDGTSLCLILLRTIKWPTRMSLMTCFDFTRLQKVFLFETGPKPFNLIQFLFVFPLVRIDNYCLYIFLNCYEDGDFFTFATSLTCTFGLR